MSETPSTEKRILSLKWEKDNKRFEMILNDNTTVYIPEETAEQMLLDLPNPNEELRIRICLARINQIRTERLLEYETIDKGLEDCLKRLQNAEKALEPASDKTEIFKWTAIIKSIQTSKNTFDAKRHLARLMFVEEAKYKALLQKTELLAKSGS